MAVLIHRGNDEVNFHDDETGMHCYTVTDAGVLRVIKQNAEDWTVLFEYSPSGWLDVQGTRHVGTKLDKMSGSDGITKEVPKNANVTVL